MAKNEEIASLSVSLALATDKFDKAITTVNKQIKQSEREFKEASKGIENFENSFKGLDSKIQATSKQLDLYNQKLEVQQKKLSQVEADYDKQKKKLDEIERTLDKGSDEWKKQAELVQKTSDKYNKISSDIKNTQSNINRLNKDLKGSKEQFKALEDSLKGTGEEAKSLSDKLSSIDNSTKLAVSEFNKLESTLDSSSSEFDKLQIQLKKVGAELEGSKSKFKAYSNEIEALEQTLKDSKSEYDLLGQKIKDLESDLASSGKTFGSNSKEVNKLKQELLQLKDSQNRVSSEIKNTASSLNKLQTEANNTVSDVNRLGKEFKDLQSEINDLNTNKAIKEINKLMKEFKEAENEITELGNNLKDFGDSFSNVSLGFTGIGAGAIAAAIEADNAMGKIQGSLGMTSKEAEKTKDRVQDLAQNGFNFSDTLDNITKVEQAMGDMLDPRQIDDLVAELQVFENYFEADVQDSIKAVSSMMRNFGITGQEATDVIAKGFQIGLNASDDWLDTLWEYGVQFADLGLTADDTLKLIANGMESGAFNTDKLADALKEGKIRLLEMSESSKGAVEALGLNAETVQNNIAKGGESARNQIIELSKKIMEIKDPIEQNTVAVGIFGTMFEDLGIEAVEAIANINSNMIESKGTADKVRESYEETFGAKFTGMLERIKEPLAKIGIVFLEIAEPLVMFAGHIAEVISLVPGLDLVAAAFIGIMVVVGPIISLIANATIAFSGLSTVFGAGTASAGLFTGATKVLSTILNAGATIFTKTTGVVKVLGGALTSVGGIFSTVGRIASLILSPAIKVLAAAFALPGAKIAAVISVGSLLIKNWEKIVNMAKKVGNAIASVFSSKKTANASAKSIAKARSISFNPNDDEALNDEIMPSSFSEFSRKSTIGMNNLLRDMQKVDYYSNRYRASSDNTIAKSVSSNNSNSDIKNELKQQNNLLTQLLNVMQSNSNDGGIHLNIENFNNNRNIDIKTLYEELEYYKYQSKLARGGV